jgi:hypothetical protein
MWVVPIMTGVGILMIVVCLAVVWKLEAKEKIKLAATLVTTLATVVLAVFSWQQMREVQRLQIVERSAQWSELQNAIMYEVRRASKELDGIVAKNFEGILTDVSYVWEKLVLDSGEISATGGRPKEE